MGREASEAVANAPVIFAGHGARLPARGIDQLAGANFQGAVALILAQGPQGVDGFPTLAERARTLTEAGAVAVIAIVDTGTAQAWAQAVRGLRRGTTRLDSTVVPRITGAMPLATAQRLISAAGGDLERMLNDQPGSSFRSIALFVRIGRGTLAPWDPTRVLITADVYRLSRNPMKSGLFLVLLGECLVSGSRALMVWAGAFFIANVIYIRRFEEPGLERRFGAAYAAYRAQVPRWLGWRGGRRVPLSPESAP